ncbi:MAG: hypothetical protein KDN22_03465, partial [Verrucomicrobiae bacterium]|nr:hypothetical protein [Verrucomicrobiae bacterium]
MLRFVESFWPIYLTALAMIIFLIVDKVRRRTHRKRVRRFDFPLKWVKILEQNVPLYGCMPYDLQEH